MPYSADDIDRILSPGRTAALDAAAARIASFAAALHVHGAPLPAVQVFAFLTGLCWGAGVALWRGVLIGVLGLCFGAGATLGALLVLRHVAVP